MDKIILPQICCLARHGVYEEEKTTPQPFCIYLELRLDLARAAAADDVAHTLHYGEIYQQVQDFMQQKSFALLEALAVGLAELMLEKAQVQSVLVRVEKQQAKFGSHTFPACVEVERQKR